MLLFRDKSGLESATGQFSLFLKLFLVFKPFFFLLLSLHHKIDSLLQRHIDSTHIATNLAVRESSHSLKIRTDISLHHAVLHFFLSEEHLAVWVLL